MKANYKVNLKSHSNPASSDVDICLTSVINRLMRPRETGMIQVESGRVRSGNHRAPPVASAASDAKKCVKTC